MVIHLMSKINKLSDAQLERLSLLAEEMAESTQIISKIIRFGVDAYNPKDLIKKLNKDRLEEELGHVLNVIDMMCKANDISYDKIIEYKNRKANTVKQYLSYN